MKGTYAMVGFCVGFGLISTALAKSSDGVCLRQSNGQSTITRKLDQLAKGELRRTKVVSVKSWKMGDLPLSLDDAPRIAALGFVAPPVLTKEEVRRIDFIELLEAIDSIKVDFVLPKKF